MLGSAVPLAVPGLVRHRRGPWSYVPPLLAAFCLIADGVYLGIGSFAGVGDAGVLIRYGSPGWVPDRLRAGDGAARPSALGRARRSGRPC